MYIHNKTINKTSMTVSNALKELFKEYNDNVEDRKTKKVKSVVKKLGFFQKFLVDNKEAVIDGFNVLEVLKDFSKRYKAERGKDFVTTIDSKYGLYEFNTTDNNFKVRYADVYESTNSRVIIKVEPMIYKNCYGWQCGVSIYKDDQAITKYDMEELVSNYSFEELNCIERCLDRMIKRWKENAKLYNFKSVQDDLNDVLESIKVYLSI